MGFREHPAIGGCGTMTRTPTSPSVSIRLPLEVWRAIRDSLEVTSKEKLRSCDDKGFCELTLASLRKIPERPAPSYRAEPAFWAKLSSLLNSATVVNKRMLVAI